MKKKQKVIGTLNIRRIPKALVQHFKAWCMLRGLSMTEKVTLMIREVIQERKKGDTE